MAEWVGAIGTVGTLAAAVWVAKREVDNRRADTDERERRQASKVSCWVEHGSTGTAGSSRPSWIVSVQNGSDEPIYGVSVVQEPGYVGGEPTGWWDVIPPGTQEGAVWDPDIEHVDREPKPVLEFNDAAGRGWTRDADGILRRDSSKVLS